MTHKISTIIASLVFSVSAVAAPATEGRKFGVLSMVGDSVDIVTVQMVTGSNLDRNAHNKIATPHGPFDRTASLAVRNAIRKLDAGASVALFGATLFPNEPARNPRIENRRFVSTADLNAALAEDRITHLVLLTRYRASADFQLVGQLIGTGKLEGLGFYIDPATELTDTRTGEMGSGFLAPYAYFKISFIDVASAAVLKERDVVASKVISAAQNKNGADAWGALTATQKVEILNEMLRREIDNAFPDIIGP